MWTAEVGYRVVFYTFVQSVADFILRSSATEPIPTCVTLTIVDKEKRFNQKPTFMMPQGVFPAP